MGNYRSVNQRNARETDKGIRKDNDTVHSLDKKTKV
jgi:hypothetical protein